MRLNNKTALITGGAGDIGAAIAKLFLMEGARVVLVDRDDAALSRVSEAIGSNALRTVTCDIASESDVKSLFEGVANIEGSLHCLVNNAAVREHTLLADADAASWERILAVNVTGTHRVTRYALPLLRVANGASIVNVASTYGLSGRGGMGQYDATKAAMISSTRVLAIEEAKHGVRVNAVCPGSILTGFTLGRAGARGMTHDELKQRGFVPAPINRWGEPTEIAAPVLWLASDEASFITGAALPVDGGVSAAGMRFA